VAATALSVLLSHDSGATWETIAGAPGGRAIEGLAFLPGSDQVLLATCSMGLLKSMDQGRTWSPRHAGLPRRGITGLALHPDGQRLYASNFSFGGLFLSEDGGDSWQAFPQDGLATNRVWALALDPTSPDRLVASASSGGLHLTTVHSLESRADDAAASAPAPGE
jgi:photosystem II stability/assembly factor-like uncharacterized protein